MSTKHTAHGEKYCMVHRKDRFLRNISPKFVHYDLFYFLEDTVTVNYAEDTTSNSATET